MKSETFLYFMSRNGEIKFYGIWSQKKKKPLFEGDHPFSEASGEFIVLI